MIPVGITPPDPSVVYLYYFFIRPLKNRLEIAQILLDKPFKNHRKK